MTVSIEHKRTGGFSHEETASFPFADACPAWLRAAALGEPSSALSAAQISGLQSLAGESGAAWSEGTPPSKGMNAFQMWQWTDWFLSNEVRSVLGAVQDLEQLDAFAQALVDEIRK